MARRHPARLVIVLLWSIQLPGCSSISLNTPSSPVGSAAQAESALELENWRFATADGSTIYSNAPPEVAQRVASRFAHFVALTEDLIGRRDRDVARSVKLFLFSNDAQFSHFSGSPWVGGHAVAGDDETRLGLSLADWSRKTAVLYHELVHILLFQRAGREYPPWFHEGLAEFLGSTVIRSDVASVGGLQQSRMHVIRGFEALPLDTILGSSTAIRTTPLETTRFYADSWAFVHYGIVSGALGNSPRNASLMLFADRVASGESWRGAFDESFDASIEVIEAEFIRHRARLASSELNPVLHIVVPEPSLELEFRSIDPVDIGRELGNYALDTGAGRSDLTGALFDYVLESQPRDAPALLGRVRVAADQGEFALADELLGRVSTADLGRAPGLQARAALALARFESLPAEGRAPERRELLGEARAAFEATLAQRPNSRAALIGLGMTYVLEEDADPSAGIEAYRRALASAPREPDCHLGLAKLLMRADQQDSAREHVDFILENYEGQFREEAEQLEKDLDSET